MNASDITTLEDITIEHIVQNVFPTYTTKKRKKDIAAFYTQLLGLDLFGDNGFDGTIITEEEVRKRIDEVLKEDRNSPMPYLNYSNQYYKKIKKKSGPVSPSDMIDSNYMGKGGECVVMGELLFHGYNVNNMMVDEGIDLVASKNNVFFYIQVKTKNVEQQNRFYFQIKQDRFDTFVGTQIRYILVARCLFKNEERNIFFTFTNNDIQRFIYKGLIPQPAENSKNLSIKIEFDQRTGKAYIYDSKNKEDVSFNMNNFKL